MDDRAPDYDFRVARPAATLRQHVTQSIRNAIAVGRFKAGERMTERDLCAMTDVSRTLVREALRQLESEGLVEVVAHRGPVVANITAEQARGIYQVREVLEGLAAELFAEQASAADKRALQTAFDAVKEAYRHGDIVARLSAKNTFYDCIVKGSGNEALGKSLHMVNARTTLLRARSLSQAGRVEKSLTELQALIEVLIGGDAKAAREAAVRHVRAAAAVVMVSFREDAGVERARQAAEVE